MDVGVGEIGAWLRNLARYYLGKNLWDDLADLFAVDGSMELAQRGVYKGRERVKQFLFEVGEVMALPWKQIIMHLPEVARAAKTVWNHYQGKPRPEIDPNTSVERQLDAIAKRIAALEANEKEQAAVVSQIADQLEGLALGLKETAARQAITTRLSVVALLLSIAAMVMAYLA